MSLRSPCHVLAILLLVSVGGCTSATVADTPMGMAGQPANLSTATRSKIYTELVRGFNQSLTEVEKKAAIASLQNDRERAKAAARLR